MNGNRPLIVVLGVVLVFLIANIILLDYVLFSGTFTSRDVELVQPLALPDITETSVPPKASVTAKIQTSAEINNLIKIATESLTLGIDAIVGNGQQVTTVTQNQPVKEYYVPLGTGSTNSTTWVDLPGVEAYIAPSNYGTIVEMYLEVAVRVPTGSGQVFARLKNVTDNNSLFESEVSYEGTAGKLISSGKIPVPTQTRLYRMQLRSSLGAEVVLDNARIKLFVK